ncbi:MAG: heparan-alpha-glucosaminide N-acetyltransferase domain-containing protein [Acidimicrobiia bacterium]
MTVTRPQVVDLTGAGSRHATEPAGGRRRVVALDAVRGLAIVVLLTAMHPGPRGAFPAQYQHPEWHGLSFIDLFFPVFLFAVGASIPFSSRGERAGAVAWRAAKLFLIGVALVSVTNGELRPAGVLQHIAIAYLVAWLVLQLPRRAQVAVAVGALGAAWAAFVAFAEGPDPWSMEGGFAHDVNTWFFGNFRTEGIPQSVLSALNVLVGAWCGQLVRATPDPRRLVQRAALLAAGLVVAGLALSGWVPINKKLWTPSYVLVTAGASVAFFAAFAWLLEVRRWRAWAQPLVELGSNAIGVYIAVILALGFLPRVRGPIDRALDDLASPAVITWGWAVAWLLLGWLVCRWLYRRRLFLKI